MDDAVWLSSAEQRAWRRTAAVMTLLPAALDAQLQRDAGMTQFAYLVLAMLSEAPGRTLTMSELAGRVNSSLSRLSHVVSRLEAQACVRRGPCPGNRRVTIAELTDTGWDRVVAAAPGHAAEVRRLLFEALDADDVARLTEILGTVLGRLDPEERMGAGASAAGS